MLQFIQLKEFYLLVLCLMFPLPFLTHSSVFLGYINKIKKMVTDYLIRYQLGPSSIFTMSVLHSTTFPFFNYKCAETLSENHPFIRLRRALNVFNLIIAPADKNRILVIAPNELFQNEINIHLSDGETYLQLTQVKYDQYIRQIIDVVMETMLFYGEPICSYLRLEHLV
jgi:hypothetical protein